MNYLITDARHECLRYAADWLRKKPGQNVPAKYKVLRGCYNTKMGYSVGKVLARLPQLEPHDRLVIAVPYMHEDEKAGIRTFLAELQGRGVEITWVMPKDDLNEFVTWNELEGVFEDNPFYEKTEEEVVQQISSTRQEAETRRANVQDYLKRAGAEKNTQSPAQPKAEPLKGTAAITAYIDYKLLPIFMETIPVDEILEEIVAALADVKKEEEFTLPVREAEKVMRHRRLGSPIYAGSSPRVQEFKGQILQSARAGGSVLISGETGTGKEAIAFFLHEFGPDPDGPFYTLNCAGLHENTLKSQLFGHVRGAYTGADTPHVGLVTMADGGTLFLDELPDMPPQVQAELLRFLQSGEYSPMGSNHTFYAKVRVVAAAQPGRAASLREDLLFRIRQEELNPPSLRELGRSNPKDLVTIARNLVARLLGAPRVAGPGEIPWVDRRTLSAIWNELGEKDIQARLAHYDWPGNAREMQEVVRRRACRGEALKSILEKKAGEMHARNTGWVPSPSGASEGSAHPWCWFAPVEKVEDIHPLSELEAAYVEHVRPLAIQSGMKTPAMRALQISHEKYLKLLGEPSKKRKQKTVKEDSASNPEFESETAPGTKKTKKNLMR